MSEEKVKREEFQVDGDAVISTIKGIIHEGNIRRITLKNEEGKTLIEIPLTIGVVGALLLPVWAAVGAIAALAVNLTIVVEKIETVAKPPAESVVEPAAEAQPEAQPAVEQAPSGDGGEAESPPQANQA